MRLRGDAARSALEWTLRGGALAVLAGYLVHTVLARGGGATESARTAALAPRLARWSTAASPARVNVLLDHPPVGRDRDWLAALWGVGTRVAWTGPRLAPTAVAAEPRADPRGGLDVSVAAPAGAAVTVADTLGVLDTTRAGGSGVRVYVPEAPPTVDAVVGPVDARAAVRDSLALRRLFVAGDAGWETKFVVAALEERGWRVDARFALSPKGDVAQGGAPDLDTARYAAVVAIDSSAARYAQRIAAFVREGGGLVLWSPAAQVRALAGLAPGAPGDVIRDPETPVPDSAPRSVLELVPIVAPAPDAVVLERRGSRVAIAARREGLGRVIEIGYTDVWRWRMAGGPEGPDGERTWLAGLVSLVAYAPRLQVAAAPSDAAPLASLIDRLGPPSAEAAAGSIPPGVLARWAFGLLCAGLLLEWASRRLRGVK